MITINCTSNNLNKRLNPKSVQHIQNSKIHTKRHHNFARLCSYPYKFKLILEVFLNTNEMLIRGRLNYYLRVQISYNASSLRSQTDHSSSIPLRVILGHSWISTQNLTLFIANDITLYPSLYFNSLYRFFDLTLNILKLIYTNLHFFYLINLKYLPFFSLINLWIYDPRDNSYQYICKSWLYPVKPKWGRTLSYMLRIPWHATTRLSYTVCVCFIYSM